jgi:hypothetical protein
MMQAPAFINRPAQLLAICILCLVNCVEAADFQGANHALSYEGPPINYQTARPEDAVTKLQERIRTGELDLGFDQQFGYLRSVLNALKVPPSSQMLVFSKTSLQRRNIRPDNPRAIFFNDDVYIGFIPGAPAIEISTADPKLGAVFYRLENKKFERPEFTREMDCLSCHGSQRTLGVPGHFVRSVGTDDSGELDNQTEIKDIDHSTPFSDRWAGWYVTGKHGDMTHRGNLVGAAALKRAEQEPNFHGNLDDLSELLETDSHLRPSSDVVALLVLEHQAKMHNYITRLSFETQLKMGMYGHIRYLRSQVDAFLRFLLFVEEAPLTARVSGNEEYAQWFTSRGPFDKKGRSLREFNLKTRLFEYPCSYLIYSEQFDAIPSVMRDQLLQRLHSILTGTDNDPAFAALNAEDRAVILEILRETKANLPDYWKK